MKKTTKDARNFNNERREHGCDVCHNDVPTELFKGYRFNMLWICGECFSKLTGEKPLR